MPDYDHQCQNKECAHEWEESYSIMADPPKVCPKCSQETAKRVISAAPRGVVELTGQELVSKLRSDAKKISKEASKNEYLYANLLSESKYNDLQSRIDRSKK